MILRFRWLSPLNPSATWTELVRGLMEDVPVAVTNFEGRPTICRSCDEGFREILPGLACSRSRWNRARSRVPRPCSGGCGAGCRTPPCPHHCRVSGMLCQCRITGLGGRGQSTRQEIWCETSAWVGPDPFRVSKPTELRIKGRCRITEHDAVVRVAGIGPIKMAEQSLVAEHEVLASYFHAQPVDAAGLRINPYAARKPSRHCRDVARRSDDWRHPTLGALVGLPLPPQVAESCSST